MDPKRAKEILTAGMRRLTSREREVFIQEVMVKGSNKEKTLLQEVLGNSLSQRFRVGISTVMDLVNGRKKNQAEIKELQEQCLLLTEAVASLAQEIRKLDK